MVNSNSLMLLCRVYDYKYYSFIEEHQKVLQENGECWILKSGKKISPARMKDVLNESGFIVLKTPKSGTDKFYLCKIAQMTYNKPIGNKLFPKYYEQYMQENGWAGQWINVKSMR